MKVFSGGWRKFSKIVGVIVAQHCKFAKNYWIVHVGKLWELHLNKSVVCFLNLPKHQKAWNTLGDKAPANLTPYLFLPLRFPTLWPTTTEPLPPETPKWFYIPMYLHLGLLLSSLPHCCGLTNPEWKSRAQLNLPPIPGSFSDSLGRTGHFFLCNLQRTQ